MKKILLISCFGFISVTQSQVNLLLKLEACYPLDCNGANQAKNYASTGSALDGVVNGNVSCTTGHLSAPNTAALFGGTSSDYINLPNDSRIKPKDTITVSGWYYVTALPQQDILFMKNTCSSNFNAISFCSDNGRFLLQKRPGSPGSCGSGITILTPSTATYAINAWHHVVFYVDNFKLYLYVDNSLAVSSSHSIPFDYATTDVILGGTNQSAANQPYSGKIDNLRFWDRELSAAEISVLYNSDPACDERGEIKRNQLDLTSIAEYEKDSYRVYPNPTSDKLYIDDIKGGKVIVYSVSGQIVPCNTHPNDTGVTEIDLSGNTPGMYFLKILDTKGTTKQISKIILK